jgi:hypothetical protein
MRRGRRHLVAEADREAVAAAGRAEVDLLRGAGAQEVLLPRAQQFSSLFGPCSRPYD